MTSPRIGALFAGYGGLDLATTDVFGGSLAWYSEVDKGALKILGHRFPEVPNVGDVTAVDWSRVEPVDILTGGSPCQDLSHAGRRAGMTEGTRSNLWVAMREAIAQLRPGLVIWENVRGAGSAEASSDLEFCPGCMGEGRLDAGPVLRALGRVVGDLADLGYVGRIRGLRAADVGSCHGRFRYFLAATDARSLRRGPGWTAGPGEATGGWTPADLAGRGDAPLLPTPSAVDGDGGRHSRAGDGEKGGPNQRGSSGDLMLPSAVAGLLPTPTTRDHKDHTLRREPHRPDDIDTLARALADVPAALLPNGNGHGPSLNVEAQRLADNAIGDACCPAYGQSWITEDGTDYGPAVRRWHDLTRCTPSPAEVGGKGGRRLNPAFSEWMMGLPAGWVTDTPGITRNEALKALGNGVVPQQAAAAIRTMLAWSEVAA